MLDARPYTFDRVMRMAMAVGFLCGLIWLLWYLSDVLIPFAAALLMAYLMNPLVSLIQKKLKNRAASVFVSLFAVAAAVLLIFLLVAPLIMREIGHMGALLSQMVSHSALTERATQFLPADLWQRLQEFAAQKEIQELLKADSVWKIAGPIAKKLLPGLWGFVAGTASFIMGLVGLTVVVLYLVFLLMDYQKVSQGWKELLPEPYRGPVSGFLNEFERAMNRYFRAQAAVAAIVGALLALGFLLIGLPLGILLGLFIGLLNMVPYLQIIGLIPAFFLALFHALETGANPWIVFAMTGLVFVVVQVIQDAVLVPRIMGKVTGLSPAMILLSLSIWGKLLGLLGLLIALPMTCLAWAYYRQFLASTRKDPGPGAPHHGDG